MSSDERARGKGENVSIRLPGYSMQQPVPLFYANTPWTIRSRSQLKFRKLLAKRLGRPWRRISFVQLRACPGSFLFVVQKKKYQLEVCGLTDFLIKERRKFWKGGVESLDWYTRENSTGESGRGREEDVGRWGLPLTACIFSIMASSSCTCESAPSPSFSAWEVSGTSNRPVRRFGSWDCVALDFGLSMLGSMFSIVPRIESKSEPVSRSRSSLFGSPFGSGDQSLASSASRRRGRPVFSLTDAKWEWDVSNFSSYYLPTLSKKTI